MEVEGAPSVGDQLGQLSGDVMQTNHLRAGRRCESLGEMKSFYVAVLGLCGQVIATFAFMGLAVLNLGISGYTLAVIFIGTLAVIGAVATIQAGRVMTGTGRAVAVAVWGLFFTGVVSYMAAALVSLHESS